MDCPLPLVFALVLLKLLKPSPAAPNGRVFESPKNLDPGRESPDCSGS